MKPGNGSSAPLRVLLLGGSGQLGTELQRRPWPMPVALQAPGRAEVDLARPECLESALATRDFDVIVNTAAYTAVDQAEEEIRLSRAVNAEAPGRLAALAAARGVPLIHVSTDYVFDGSGTDPWREDAPVGPLNVYGRTKAEGEALVRAATPHHVIVRTSWVYGASGHNFMRTMLRLADTKDHLTIVNDQVSAPTAAADIADAIITITQRVTAPMSPPALFGTFHFTAAGATSWYGFAQRIFARLAAAGHPVPALTPVPTSARPTPARRPLNSRLDCQRIVQVYGLHRRTWEAAADEVLADCIRATRPLWARTWGQVKRRAMQLGLCNAGCDAVLQVSPLLLL